MMQPGSEVTLTAGSWATAARVVAAFGVDVATRGALRLVRRRAVPTRSPGVGGGDLGQEDAQLRREIEFVDARRAEGLVPGTPLRVQPLAPVGLRWPQVPASATRIEYVATDSRDRLITTTGAVLVSHAPNAGHGVVAFAPSTQGVAAHCNPSWSCEVGVHVFARPFDLIAAYEQPVINYFLARGLDVVFIDYPRDPELDIQFYCDHDAAARSLVDAVTAARQLGLISACAPVGLWGFSQGGGCVAAALERHAAGESPVEVAGAVVGAPPADVAAVLDHVEGSLWSGVIGYATAGLAVTSAQLRTEVFSLLSARGVREMARLVGTCMVGASQLVRNLDTREWTRSGRSLSEELCEWPALRAECQRRLLGKRAPRVPVVLWGSTHDDVIPVTAVRALRERWCAGGAQVEWRENGLLRIPGGTGLNHFLPYYRHAVADAEWLWDRLR